MITANLEQTGSQLLQLLLQLIPDLRQTLTLLVLQFQFLRCARETITTTFTRKDICFVNFFQVLCVSAESRLRHLLGGVQLFPEDLRPLFSDFSFSDLQRGATEPGEVAMVSA